MRMHVFNLEHAKHEVTGARSDDRVLCLLEATKIFASPFKQILTVATTMLENHATDYCPPFTHYVLKA